MCRWVKTKKTTIGISARTLRVMKEGQSVVNSPTDLYTCSTRVLFSGRDQEHVGGDEVVPDPHGLEDGDGHQDGPDQGKHDPPVDGERAGSVDARRFDQLVGNALHVALDQEVAEDRPGGVEEHQPGEGVDQADPNEQPVQGDQGRLAGDDETRGRATAPNQRLNLVLPMIMP